MRLTVGEDTRAFAAGNLAELAKRTSEKRDWTLNRESRRRDRNRRSSTWHAK